MNAQAATTTQDQAGPALTDGGPTQLGPEGIRYDFNDGTRIVLPKLDAAITIRLFDLDTGNQLYHATMADGWINSNQRYFARFAIEFSRAGIPLFRHEYDAGDRDVLIEFDSGALGDTLGWVPFAARFADVHKARVTCAIAGALIPILAPAYPNLRFVPSGGNDERLYYATYKLGVFADDADGNKAPCDAKLVGFHRLAGYILGVDPTEAPALVAGDAPGRPIDEPYVVIAVQSTTQCKYWNNPNGWREVVEFLKQAGYRVICIDRDITFGGPLVWNHIPYGAEDETGTRPLIERLRWLRHAEFFVGLASGLSWLAWSAGIPVVMISGFSHPTSEFATPYRVINYSVCNSCWNDVRLSFDKNDFLWCPRHANTAKQFECTKSITTGAVTHMIRRIPGFGVAANARLG